MFGFRRKKPSILYAKIVPQSEPPALVKWLKKRGLARNNTQANILLFLIIIGALAASAYFFYIAADTPKARAYPAADEFEVIER